MTAITILDGEQVRSVERIEGANLDGMSVSIDDLETATGWHLNERGMCRGDVCIPVRDRSALGAHDSVDLVAFAELVRRPVVADSAVGVVAFGEAADATASQLQSGKAPDFTLTDLAGVPHTMSAMGRKKKVLVVWASW